MNERFFSESIQYQAVLENLEKNGGQLKCENCKKNINNRTECHFDHILPFSKGGKSVLSNCQILCSECNLKKNDKEMHDFVLEEKAKKFLLGDGILENDNFEVEKQKNNKSNGKLSKKEVETIIRNFVSKNGRIRRIDFARERNKLPAFSLINLYWGGIKQMQKELGFQVGVPEWNRESIKLTVEDFIKTKGDIIQSNFKSRNGLPSIPCILAYYPELHNFSEIKEFFGLKRTRQNWNHESATQAGKTFISQTNGKLTQKDLRSRNNLPDMKVIQRLFGTLAYYQKIIGAEISKKNEPITVEDINSAVIEYFSDRERVVYNQKDFFENFKYSQSTIMKNFETIGRFFDNYGITETNPKKFKFTKNEIDKIIIEFIKAGKKIPTNSTELTKVGLPSSSSILRYYDSWKEPFIYFQKLYEKIQ